MKIIGQLAIIIALFLTGKFIEVFFSLPLPGSIIGMFLLLIALHLGILKVEKIKEVSDFFLNNMMFFFIPATVSIVASYTILEGNLVAILSVIILSIIITNTAIALIVQHIASKKDKKNG